MYSGLLMDACEVTAFQLKFETPEALNAANEYVLDASNGLYFVEHDERTVGMCEMCGVLYDREHEVLGGRTGLSGFCSDECKSEADDEIRCWDIVDRNEAYLGAKHGAAIQSCFRMVH